MKNKLQEIKGVKAVFVEKTDFEEVYHIIHTPECFGSIVLVMPIPTELHSFRETGMSVFKYKKKFNKQNKKGKVNTLN